MNTTTRASTTRCYCSSCRSDRPHRDRTCTTCGFRDQPWPAGLGVEPADRTGPVGLSVRETMILDFERRWWKYQAVKESTVRDLFGVGATNYYAELNRLIDRPEAEAYAPMTVRRMRRLRAARRAARTVSRVNG